MGLVLFLGAGTGIEPIAADNETAMLPLHHPAIKGIAALLKV